MKEHSWTKRERALLERRAEALAAPLEDSMPAPVLALQVSAGRCVYALPAANVLSVRPLLRVTAIPGTASPFVGLFASRERILPAFSLAAIVSTTPVPAEKNYVIELGRREVEVGLLVEDVRAFTAFSGTPAGSRPSGCEDSPFPPASVPVVGATAQGVLVLDVASLLTGALLHISTPSDRSRRNTPS